MDDNIVKFPGTDNQNDVYQEIQDFIEEEDSETIVITYDKEGKFSFATSNPDPKEVLFNLELAKQLILNGYLFGNKLEN